MSRRVHMMGVAVEDIRFGDIVTVVTKENGEVLVRKSLPEDPEELNK